MRTIFLQIKWAYQRVVRGWDDTAMWQLDSHFVDILIPPLKELCTNVLAELFICEENKRREEVLTETLKLIEAYKRDTDYMQDDWSFEKEDNSLKALATYFGQNITMYWD